MYEGYMMALKVSVHIGAAAGGQAQHPDEQGAAAEGLRRDGHEQERLD
jgi:hypothetical protein